MNLFNRLFRRPPAISSKAMLADFIDAQSAFLTQKGIMSTRARGPAIMQRCCLLKKASLNPLNMPDGRLTRSLSQWSERWSRACCDRILPIGAAPCSTN